MNAPFSQTQKRGFLGPSLHLATVAGIPIRVHWSFSLLLLWSALVNLAATASVTGAALGLLFILVVFGCVVLHELGHSLTAQRFGIQTRSITLSPIGGLAALESSPRNWKEEWWITIAGPAVNAVIALLLLPVVVFTASPELFTVAPFSTVENFVFMIFAANVMLTLFNLIPAFPMDGGRILRALLTAAKGRRKATRIAVRIGQGTAVLMGLASFTLSPFLALIAIFVFLAASAELRQVEWEESLSGSTVSDAMRSAFATARHGDTVNEALQIALHNGQNTIPVLCDDQLIGVVDFHSLVRARESGLGHAPIGGILDSDLVTVSPHDELLPVWMRMQQREREVVPVMRERRLVGLLPRRAIRSLQALRSV